MSAVANIQIKNPAITELVAEFQEAGVGRNATETAENLIRTGADAQRAKLAKPASPSRRRKPLATP